MTWDIVIHRGLLIDGSGSQDTIADIALAAGRIAAIGPSLAGDASKVIDADGLAVTPSFIGHTWRRSPGRRVATRLTRSATT